MKLPLNSFLDQLPVYQPGRPIDEVARELGLDPRSVFKLASNENPLGPSPAALKALQDCVGQAHVYPDGSAHALKQRLARKLDVSAENLICGNGSNEILQLAAQAVVAPGSEVIVSQYCFAVYPIVTHLCGGRLVTVPAQGLAHDLAAMRAAVNPATRLLFVANPNNPTGSLASNAEVLALVESIPDHVLLVMDEAYIEFVEQAADLLPQVRSGARPNLLLCRTFSKIHGLAGLRLGYGIGDPRLIGALEKIRQPFNTNALAQAAALAALDDDAHVQRTLANNRAGLEFFARTLTELSLEFVPSAANFVLVRVGDGQQVFLQLQRQGLIVRPMASYQLPEWLRITIGTPEQNQRCIDSLARLLRPAGSPIPNA